MDKNILLLFLGGLSNDDDIINHYHSLNYEFKTKNNYYIVHHPIIFHEDINRVYNDLFNPANIHKVDIAHHIKTKWGTRSLVDATLLMIQYMHNIYGKIFNKYILLSSTCAPLYSFDTIYETLTIDDRSWISGTFKPSFHDPIHSDFFTNSELNFGVSQWMILDIQHINFFFIENTLYVKTGEEYECDNEKLNIVSIENSSLLNEAFEGFKKVFANCEIWDENFFGVIILYNILKGVSTKDHKEHILTTHFKTRPKINYTHYNIPQELNDLISTTSNLIQRKTITTSSGEKTIKYIETISKLEMPKLTELITNGKIIQIYIHEKLDARLNFKFIPSTYVNFSFSSINPFNIFKEKNKTIIYSTHINSRILIDLPIDNFIAEFDNYLDTLPKYNDILIPDRIEHVPDEIYDFIKNHAKIIYHINNNLVNNTTHPLDFSLLPLYIYINTFFLLSSLFIIDYSELEIILKKYSNNYILKSWIDNYKYLCNIYNIYLNIIFESLNINIICKQNSEISNKDNKFNILFNRMHIINTLSKLSIRERKIILELLIGNPIKDIDIIPGILSGSLFIRKCGNNSMINSYSIYLSRLKYIDKITNDLSSSNNKYLLYKNKYIKYKTKYNLLKNNLELS